jgi:hypothetical protein
MRPTHDNNFQLYVLQHMEVRPSGIPGAGKGVFWMGDKPLPAGRRIAVYTGEVLREEPRDTTYTFQQGPRTFIVATKAHHNWTKFVNDNFDSNNAEFTTDGRIRTKRPIQPGEEVFIEYGSEYWDARKSLLH